jgi:6-phosphogluconolactonase
MDHGTVSGAVYAQTNEPENAVIAYRRDDAGGLTRIGTYPTGGAGDAMPHLTSQGSVVLSGDGRFVLVSNVRSDDVSVFAVRADELELIGRTPTGPGPKSIAEHEGLVSVLNTGKPAVTGFRLGEGRLETIAGAEQSLSAGNADPAQVGFSPDGRLLLVTERGTDSLVSFSVTPEGRLGDVKIVPSSGPTPYGFAFTPDGSTLLVTEAFRAGKGKAAASSYRISMDEIAPATRSLGNGRSEICWAVVTADGRYGFTTNFADGAVSRYAIGADGTLELEDATAGLTEDGRPGLRDEALSRDGRFLYAIDADAGRIVGWTVGQDGSLSALGGWDGVPVTVAGLAAS